MIPVQLIADPVIQVFPAEAQLPYALHRIPVPVTPPVGHNNPQYRLFVPLHQSHMLQERRDLFLQLSLLLLLRQNLNAHQGTNHRL